MLSRDLLEIIAARCDACTRENLGEAMKLKFMPQKLSSERLVSLYRPEIRYDASSHTYFTYYARHDHNLHIKMTRYKDWTAYDYAFEKYIENKLVYLYNYWTDPENNIVVQQHTFCHNGDRECGCILCTQHLVNPCHDWHTLKLTRCPRRFFSFKHDKVQLLKCRVF